MKKPFDFTALDALEAVLKGQNGPTDRPQEHEVRLRQIDTRRDHRILWDEPQEWCREHVEHKAGHLWSVHTDKGLARDKSEPIYTFSDLADAVHFKLLFGWL